MSFKIVLTILVFIALGSCGQSNQSKMKTDIEEILKMDDETSALIQLDTELNSLSNYGDDLDKLNYSQKIFLFVENLEREVNNGGFHQFFFNSSGDYTHETIKALEAIGALKTVKIVEKSISVWPGQKVPGDREERQNLLEQVEKEGIPIWEQCDSDFFKYEDKIGTLLLEFVKRNKTDFK
jgi:Domain of unknown function (DUF4375)